MKRIIKIFLILSPLLLSLLSCNPFKIRKVLRVSPCRSIAESKERGSFLWEYEPDSCLVYDSIKVVVKEAFAEYYCLYEGYYTDKIWMNPNVHIVVVTFENHPWPGYYGDTLTHQNDSSYINWYMTNPYLSSLRIIQEYCLRPYYPELAPDTFIMDIEEMEQLKDSVFDYPCSPTYRAIIKRDTIGKLELRRKY